MPGVAAYGRGLFSLAAARSIPLQRAAEVGTLDGPAGTVEGHRACDVTGAQVRNSFVVARRHQAACAARMVEPDRMTDLVRERVDQIINFEITVETELPGLRSVEADEGAADLLYALVYDTARLDVGGCVDCCCAGRLALLRTGSMTRLPRPWDGA